MLIGDENKSGICRNYYGTGYDIKAKFIENSQGYLLTLEKPQLDGATETLTTMQFSPSSYQFDFNNIPVNQVIYRQDSRVYFTLDSADVSCRINSAFLLGKFARDNDIANFKPALLNFPDSDDSLIPRGPPPSKNSKILRAVQEAQLKDNVGILKALVDLGHKEVFLEGNSNPLVEALDYGDDGLKYLTTVFPEFLSPEFFTGYRSSALHEAVNRGLSDKVSLLLAAGINPNSRVTGITPIGTVDMAPITRLLPLCLSVWTSNWPEEQQIMLDLLGKNSPQNDECVDGRNFLGAYMVEKDESLGSRGPNPEVVKAAIDHGANLNGISRLFEIAMGFASSGDPDYFSRKASSWDDTAKIVDTLLSVGADVNQSFPLVSLASLSDPGAVNVAKTLLDHGGNLKKIYKTNYYNEPVTACDRASSVMSELFKRYGGCL